MENTPTTPATDHDHDADGEPATDQKAAPGLTKTAEPVSTKGAESSKETESPGAPGPENAVPAAPGPEEAVPAAPGPEEAPASDAPDPDAPGDDALEPGPYDEAEATASAEAGSGAAAVVAAGLGVVSLSGAWTGRVAAERETLIGQIKSSSGGSGSATQQISEIYGNAWHTTALVNGLFALLALLVGIFVLVRPAFGAPAAHPRPGWIRAVARAGIALGILGVLISVVMYFDLALPLPTAG
ncbi:MULTISPECIES: DUF308 domain-containing protein [unclassified Streptomyces]|uniref:DUF308 domain-containing protein n=1 Tax=unclassified Streptomyces TaxID=2593676 RepID=UPI00081B38A9|nr:MULTISPECIES: DUF308 domain-containing protein [unclassified Streptomyces]MYQ55551.1 hypothetical protein [Streptomyces sp. SID4941]SCE39394.1 hypothetical protein GA0115247_13897 [Streptomyces sp. PalvLS-984]SDD41082.1 hypothetical protein F558DRAFT_04028 [Streptomyces sp. AmelKG-A3]